MRLFSKSIWVALLVLAFIEAAFATELVGVITDSEGAVISGARVFVHWDRSGAGVGLKTNVGIKQDDLTLETDKQGRFRVELSPGFYDVFVTAAAFSPSCSKVRIKSGQVVNYDQKLRIDPLVTNELGDSFPH